MSFADTALAAVGAAFETSALLVGGHSGFGTVDALAVVMEAVVRIGVKEGVNVGAGVSEPWEPQPENATHRLQTIATTRGKASLVMTRFLSTQMSVLISLHSLRTAGGLRL
jgi:hypothetical protein